ncbi:MAG: D-alanyl-D-alanine carboxypeptidase family protein [Candidatus Gottesmanbacteria bacterium]|nr:D-alanyl-D-alanine carboxypeptidase family protein [Candidatus Gottesmanbacteria bacterium]
MPKDKIVYQHSSPWIRGAWHKILYLVILAGFFLWYPGQNRLLMMTPGNTSSDFTIPFPLPSIAPYPTNVTGVHPGDEVTAGGVVIVDVNSGVVLFQRNSYESFSPASTTKILTALVTLDMFSLDDVMTVKTLQNSGASMKLVAGERITVENLLYGALIQSGNDAAYALAENYPGGVGAFVVAMNEKAKTLHLTQSHFTNPVGFDDPTHKMTPMDLARLAGVALSNKTIVKMVAIPQITISDVTHTYFHNLTNVNALLGKIPGVGGIKTGWTEESGENLVTLVERGGHRVIIVVLKSKDRFIDTTKLIDWVFANHRWEVPAS